jgi:MFS family permease
MAGGRLTDYWTRQGYIDAPLRVGILGALAMLLFAGLYPVVPSATLVAVLLVPVNVFAAMPWGAANAAIAEAMPNRMRGQGSAIYQLVVNLVSGALGPTAVALLTDQVFADPMALRWSLALTTVVGMTLAAALLAWGRAGFVLTVSSLREQAGD